MPDIPRVVVCSGGFDPFHVGHLDHFLAAKALGDKLVVVINRDEFLLRKKGYVFMPLEERVDIIRNLRCVDEVVVAVDDDQSVAETLRLVKPQIFAQGKDRVEGNIPQAELDVCGEIGCEVRYGVAGRHRSSSEVARFYPTRHNLPPLSEFIKGHREVWAMWVTGEKMAKAGIFDGGNIKRLLLLHPDLTGDTVRQTALEAQSHGAEVRWYPERMPFSINICDPYGDGMVMVEIVVPLLGDELRPTIITDGKTHPELRHNLIKMYETIWRQKATEAIDGE
jgi:cytidyltransferase-like protein